METTLEEMLQKRPGMSMLQLKKALIVQQKNGYIALTVNIATLQLSEPFTYTYTPLSSAY